MIRMKTNNAKLGKSLRRAAGKTAALLLSFLLTVGSVPVYAVPDTDAAETAAVTSETVYPEGALLIGSEEELLAFAKDCSLDSYSKGLKVFLTSDIRMDYDEFSNKRELD